MKKIISVIVLFSSVFFFSSVAMAEVVDTLNGVGSVTDAVNSFNKAVVINGGMIDGNSKTDFSSVGNFGSYQARMYAEEKGGKVSVNISTTIVHAKVDLFAYVLSGAKNLEKDFAVKIAESMAKDGYNK